MNKQEYLHLSNIPAHELTEVHIRHIYQLMNADKRVKSYDENYSAKNGKVMIRVDCDFGMDETMSGSFSLGRIAGALHECAHERDARLEKELVDFLKRYPDDTVEINIDMTKKEMSDKMFELVKSLNPSHEKAQAYNISEKLKTMTGTIAEMMLNDHANASHALRHCYLLVEAGLCGEVNKKPNVYGTFKFIDGSQLN